MAGYLYWVSVFIFCGHAGIKKKLDSKTGTRNGIWNWEKLELESRTGKRNRTGMEPASRKLEWNGTGIEKLELESAKHNWNPRLAGCKLLND